MIKSMFKRTWLSIVRKPSKTIILMIVMFIMANLVLAAVATKNAVQESTDFAKQSIGTTVYLRPDDEALRAEAQEQMQGSGPSGGPGVFRIEIPDITVEMVESIADSTYLKDYTYSINASAKESEFTPVDNGMSSGSGPAMMDSTGKVKNLFGDIAIKGINSYAFIPEVLNNSMKIIDGTYFDELTDNKVIISNELAQNNNLEVGDIITLIHEEYNMSGMVRPGDTPEVLSSTTYEFEIIGIYDVTVSSFNGNNIYMNIETAAKFLGENEYNNGDYNVDNIEYYFNTPDDAEAFMAEANAKYPNLADDKLKLDINRDDYDKMIGPIEQVGGFADTILIAVIIASALILTLVINNNIKDRKYEMGVLMSLGGTKKNIIGQVLLEVVVIGTVAFALSIGTSNALASTLSQNLLDKQVELAEEQQQNNYGRPTNGPTGGMRPGQGVTVSGFGPSESNVEAIKTIDINVSGSDYIVLFAIGYIISIIAIIIPAINIVKYEPKTILTGRQ